MKICFVADTIGVVGGQQRILTVMANALAENNRVEVSIVFTADEKLAKKREYQLNDNIKVYWEKSMAHGKYDYKISRLFKKIYQRTFQFQIKNFVQNMIFPIKERAAYINFFSKHDFDVVIGVAPYTSAILGLINNDINSKTVGWLHNSYDRYFEYRDNLFNLKEVYSGPINQLDEVVLLTKSAVKEYEHQFERQFRYIYNPLTFKSESVSNLKNNNKILFVGRIFYATKGLDLLIKILTNLVSINKEFTIDIVGDGPDMERLKIDLQNNNLKNYVNLVGSSDNVQKYYKSSDVFISTSRVEGFGLVVTEAMECGLPVISFTTEGPSEIIIDNLNGFLIENYNTLAFANRLNDILNNPKKRQNLGKAAKLRANDFDIEIIVSEWVKLLEDLTYNS